MVASKQVKIPICKIVGQQRGRGFGALAQAFGKTAIAFFCEDIVPAAKRVGADLLGFAAPEIAEVVGGRKGFKTARKSVGRRTLRRQLGSGSRKKNCEQNHSNKNLETNNSVAKRPFLKHFSILMSSNFRY